MRTEAQLMTGTAGLKSNGNLRRHTDARSFLSETYKLWDNNIPSIAEGGELDNLKHLLMQ